MSADNSRTMSIVSFVVPTIVSALTTAITIGFLLGGTDKTIESISQTQKDQGLKIEALTNSFNNLDKSQALMSLDLSNVSTRLNESNQTLNQLNQDIRCIRYVVSSKGDINKC